MTGSTEFDATAFQFRAIRHVGRGRQVSMRNETGVPTAGSRSEPGRKELGHRIDGLKRDVVRPAASIITL